MLSILTSNAHACISKELEVCDFDEMRRAQHNISLVQFLYNRQHVNMASNGKINCALCPRARRVVTILRCHSPISRRKSSQTHQQYAGCLNVCKDWWCLVLCNVNRSYVFVQSVRYFSCQTRSKDTAVLRRSVTDAIFIDDFITINNSLRLRGDRKESGFFENMVFTFHEFSTASLSVHVIYAVGISGHVLDHF